MTTTTAQNYSLQEIFSLAQNTARNISDFSKKADSAMPPSAKKARARYQSIESLIEKVQATGLISKSTLVNEGLWLSSFRLNDVQKTSKGLYFVTGHEFGGRSVSEIFSNAVNYTQAVTQNALKQAQKGTQAPAPQQ